VDGWLIFIGLFYPMYQRTVTLKRELPPFNRRGYFSCLSCFSWTTH